MYHEAFFDFSPFTFYFHTMAVSPELLAILRCPKCKSELQINDEQTRLKCVNPECSLVYPIREDIPVMLIEEATEEKA